MESREEALSDIIRKLENKEILLPDFQRKFVWKEEERQKRLVASVLAKMPVGSILLLKSDANEYAYKLIGCKERKTSKDLNVSGEILALLDGQQRLTVLTNAFSNVIFDLSGGVSKLISEVGLKRRFFLKIPRYFGKDDSTEDFFGARKLVFPLKDQDKEEPEFLSDEMYSAVECLTFNAKDENCYNPYNKGIHKSELVEYCLMGEEYLLPLFLLTGSNEAWLKNIITRISDSIQLSILEEYESIPEEKKEEYVKSILTEDILELAENIENITDNKEFEKELKKQGDNWADAIKTYLISCLNRIQLTQIIVEKSKRDRAINIYENLNKGGISLGTFELIMAKFAGESTENYYDKIENNMRKKRKYDIEMFVEALKNNEKVKKLIFDDEEYVATLALGCIEKKDSEISKTYIDIYLNVISLYTYVPDFDKSKIKLDFIKKNKILALSGKDLDTKCDAVCEAIDQAMFFFQMRCGIRTIKEINYSLMIMVVAYILLNHANRTKKTYDYLEAWYWSSILSGYFVSDQNARAIKSLVNLLYIIETDDIQWLKEMKDKMFKSEFFSDRDFLLMKKGDGLGIAPKEFLRGIVCQFYLASTYKGLFDDTIDINAFEKLNLEKHHVIPLGSFSKSKKVNSGNEKLRKDGKFFLNSPMNFIYITEGENLEISDDDLVKYQQRISAPETRETLGFSGELDAATEEKCRQILEQRFDKIEGKIHNRITMLLPK